MSWVRLNIYLSLSLGEFGGDWQLGWGTVDELALGGDSGLSPGI